MMEYLNNTILPIIIGGSVIYTWFNKLEEERERETKGGSEIRLQVIIIINTPKSHLNLIFHSYLKASIFDYEVFFFTFS